MDSNALLGKIFIKKNLTLAVAESCSGGLISKLITDVPNSSLYFHSGIITYSNEAKILFLDIDKSIFERYGAVSEECAEAMVKGLRQKTKCDICVSTTGIAGPGGGSYDKPVGLVYTGFYIYDKQFVFKLFFKGNRELIRLQTANFCLKFLINSIGYE